MKYYVGSIRCSDELWHFGIKGMAWGRRRYQNEDGTYTAEGRARYGYGNTRGNTFDASSGNKYNSKANAIVNPFSRVNRTKGRAVSELESWARDRLGRNVEGAVYGNDRANPRNGQSGNNPYPIRRDAWGVGNRLRQNMGPSSMPISFGEKSGRKGLNSPFGKESSRTGNLISNLRAFGTKGGSGSQTKRSTRLAEFRSKFDKTIGNVRAGASKAYRSTASFGKNVLFSKVFGTIDYVKSKRRDMQAVTKD